MRHRALFCPAYGGMCGYSCFVRRECESNPEGVRAMMECLDPLTVKALAAKILELVGRQGR